MRCLRRCSPQVRGSWVSTGGEGFRAVSLKWHQGNAGNLHPSTWLHDESTIVRHLIPAFGPLSLREVDVARVNEFRRQLVASGLSGKSVTNLIGTLNKVMTDATEELITANPVLRIRSGRRRRAGAAGRSRTR